MPRKKKAKYDPAIVPLDHFKNSRISNSPAIRLENVVRDSVNFRNEMLAANKVKYFRSFDLIRVPYPTKYAYLNAISIPSPMTHIFNRLFVVQVDSADGLKTVLVSPSDIHANEETPFFKRLSDSFGRYKTLGKKLVAPEINTVPGCLEQIGLSVSDIDYITYDHLHTQDIRNWLGSYDREGLFPNAKLLVMKEEWESTLSLLPPQRDWYCPGGIDGVDPAKIVLLEEDVMVGEGLALIKTPGHTVGNHSIVVHSEEGLFVTSENGVGPDNYAPFHSDIPGLRAYAQNTGAEVVMNGNTLEGSVEQYISMVQEKTIAGPSMRNPDFPNMLCSSEMTAYWAFPGLKPTFSFGEVAYGVLSA